MRAAPLLFLIAIVPSQVQAPVALRGAWEGHAEVRSESLGDEGLPVRLVVNADGSVTGTVGDAELVRGRLGPNRTLFARLFGLGEPWIIKGDLRGPLVAADSLTRTHASMPVHMDGQDMVAGDLNATGGGKLISVRLWLRRD